MRAYDPAKQPAAGDWLSLDEDERIYLVTSYHRRKRLRAPNPRLHALFHVIIENQLALKEQVVVETLARLQGNIG